MSILLAIRNWDVDAWTARFAALDPGRTIQRAGADDLDLEAVDYGVAWHPEPGLFARCPNLKAVFSLGAGVDHILRDPSLPDVPVARIVDPNLTMRMTEWVTLHVLLHHRRQRALDAAQREGRWAGFEQAAACDMRVGILGLGELGRDAAEVLARVGFRVAGWSRSPKTIPGIETFSGADGLDRLLARTDILVCLLPLTPDTAGILDYRLFSRLSRDGPLGAPVIVNAGRGGLQVEADIVRALDDGTLLAASLDVFETEPLPADSPLWHHPGVVVTPHNAADSTPEHMSRNVIDQIRAFERGEPLRNLVDRDSGY